MKNDVLSMIDNKSDYMAVLEALTTAKQDYTEEEAVRLLAVYTDNTESKFGFAGEELAKLLLVLDTAAEKGKPETSPLAGVVNPEGLAALAALAAQCVNWAQNPEPALEAKDLALAGDSSDPLTLALARTALDTLAGQKDATACQKEITALAEFLKQADDAVFENASRFLVRVMERVR